MSILAKVTIAASLAALCAAHAIGGPSRTVVLKVERMVCSGCVQSLQRGLLNVRGVQQVAVDLDKKMATVQFDESQTDAAALTRATAAAGFPAAVRP